MKKKPVHKFQEKMLNELTYEQYFQDRYKGMVSLIKAFELTLGRKRAFEIVQKWAEKSGIEFAQNQSSMTPIETFEDFALFMKKEDQSPFWTHVLKKTIIEETSVKLSCHITECLWAETFKKMKATNLGYIICCHPDFAMAETYHPKIRLKRTKTLMQGDSYCNHIYYWKE